MIPEQASDLAWRRSAAVVGACERSAFSVGIRASVDASVVVQHMPFASLYTQVASAIGHEEVDPINSDKGHQMPRDHQKSINYGHQMPGEWPLDAQTLRTTIRAVGEQSAGIVQHMPFSLFGTQGASAIGQVKVDPVNSDIGHQMPRDHQKSTSFGHQMPGVWPLDAQTLRETILAVGKPSCNSDSSNSSEGRSRQEPLFCAYNALHGNSAVTSAGAPAAGQYTVAGDCGGPAFGLHGHATQPHQGELLGGSHAATHGGHRSPGEDVNLSPAASEQAGQPSAADGCGGVPCGSHGHATLAQPHLGELPGDGKLSMCPLP